MIGNGWLGWLEEVYVRSDDKTMMYDVETDVTLLSKEE